MRSSSPSPEVRVYVDLDWSDSRRSKIEPSHRLLIAIIRRAVWDFVLYRDIDIKKEPSKIVEYGLAEDAAGWLWWDGEEEVDEHGRHTFVGICNTLGIDPRTVREYATRLSRDDIYSMNNHIKDD